MKNKKFFKAAFLLNGMMLAFSMISCESMLGILSEAASDTVAELVQRSSNPFVGTWRGTMSNGSDSLTTTIMFNADGTGTIQLEMTINGETGKTDPIKLTYTINNNTLTYYTEIQYGDSGNNCTVSGNTLTVHLDPPQTLNYVR
jgi:hypothetical protein